MRKALLTGSWRHPLVVMRLPGGDRQGLAAIKDLPGRVWDADRRTWVVDGLGNDPAGWLRRHRFALERDNSSEAADYDLDELVDPYAHLFADSVLVRPRLAGVENILALLPGGTWDADRRLMRVRIQDFVESDGALLSSGIVLGPGLRRALEAHRFRRPAVDRDLVKAALADGRNPAEWRAVRDRVGDVPDWFTVLPEGLHGYQVAGALALAAGRSYIADTMGLGKQQPISEPVLTPSGWRPIGTLEAGDRVITPDGTAAPVTGVFPQTERTTYRITFSDDSWTLAGPDHLWRARTNPSSHDWRTVTTLDMASSPHQHWEIPMTAPVNGPDVELPCPPYSMGTALGRSQDGGTIPARLLLGSAAQRLELLQGLMDAGASPLPGGGADFSSTSRPLVDGLVEIVESLGGTARLHHHTRHWTVEVRMPPHMPPFRLQRKLEQWTPQAPPRRVVQSIERVADADSVCITVDHPDHLYLTRHHIVTHNTYQLLAAAAVRNVRRLVVAVPASAVSVWQRHVDSCRLAEHCGDGGGLITIIAGRKEPALTGDGVLVVSMDLLARRKGLLERVLAWGPDSCIVDEAHQISSWSSQRSRALRALAKAIGDGPRWAASGTPMSDGPGQLASQLAYTGDLERIFGGYSGFMRRYCYRTPFGGWKGRKKRLAELSRILNQHVWVRRDKMAVLVDEAGQPLLPSRTLRGEIVDVPLSDYRAAHRQVTQAIDDWLDEVGTDLSDTDITKYTRANLPLVTMLDTAAGLAKRTVAARVIRDWVADHPARADGTWPRPLIVWVHHRQVGVALANAVRNDVDALEIYSGSTTGLERSRIADAFQAGRVAVLLASKAAYASITLTAGSDMLFVEQFWNPGVMAQAIGRCWRLGQTRPVLATVMVAAGTLDEHKAMVLSRKGKVLDAIAAGPDNAMGVLPQGQGVEKRELLARMVRERLARRRPHIGPDRGGNTLVET